MSPTSGMSGLRSVINFAMDRKRVPAFTAGSMLDLARKLGKTSLRSVRTALEGLPNATVIFNSPDLSTGHVSAVAQLGLQSDGCWSFRGNIHEGGVFGDYYAFTAVLNGIKDPAGNVLAFASPSSGNKVTGQGDIFASTDSHTSEWQVDGFSQLIADQWDAVKTSTVDFKLHVNTNPLEAVGDLLGIGLVLLGSGIALASCIWGDDVSMTSDDSGGAGFECKKTVTF